MTRRFKMTVFLAACKGAEVIDAEAPLVPLPSQPDGLAWPTDSWARGDGIPAVDTLVDEMFGDVSTYETTYCVVVVHHGVIVAERYGNELPNWVGEPIPVSRKTPLLSWSMAKSMLHAIVGILIGDGRLRLDDDALVPEWRAPDPRHAITVADLLAMRDGLAWNEDYVDAGGSQVIDMLFGEGNADVGAFARSRDLAHEPGTHFNYSSGTTNVISGIVADIVGRGDAYRDFLHRRLFAPIGMTTAVPTLDATGLWVASSYVHAIAEDFARFGFLYLRDGVWDSARVLPVGWVDDGRRLRSIDPDDGRGYGWQWWVTGDDHGTFWANGYEGQSIVISPANDLVCVRIGRTDASHGRALFDWRARIVDAVAAV